MQIVSLIAKYVRAKSLQLCLTLCNPMDCHPWGSSIHGFLQARILEWVAISSFRGSSWQYVIKISIWDSSKTMVIIPICPSQFICIRDYCSLPDQICKHRHATTFFLFSSASSPLLLNILKWHWLTDPQVTGSSSSLRPPEHTQSSASGVSF